MKSKARLWDELALILDSEPYSGRWAKAKNAFAELSGHYALPWWRRILMKIKGWA